MRLRLRGNFVDQTSAEAICSSLADSDAESQRRVRVLAGTRIRGAELISTDREDLMSNADFQPDLRSASTEGSNQSNRGQDRNGAAAMASEAVDLAGRAASATMSTVSREAKQLLDKQVGKGASMLGSVGSSVKAAARELESGAPQMAGFVRSVGERIDEYATDLEGQTVDGVIRSAGDLARRQPALVFGLTALAGFLVMRTLKSTPARSGFSDNRGYGGDRSYGDNRGFDRDRFDGSR
jgi:hypothetical protein